MQHDNVNLHIANELTKQLLPITVSYLVPQDSNQFPCCDIYSSNFYHNIFHYCGHRKPLTFDNSRINNNVLGIVILHSFQIT